MKNRRFLFVTTCLILLVLTGLLLWRNAGSKPAATAARGDAGCDLQTRVATQPKPALTNLLRQKPVAAQPPPSTPTASAVSAARLTEEALEPLRRAFVPVRFTEDPNLPRERQTLLSNRLLISPEKRALPKTVSGKQGPTSRGTTPFIVQFSTPVSDTARKLLTDAGATVRGYFPNNAILAELTPRSLASLEGIASVSAASEYLPSDKVQPFLTSLTRAFPPSARVSATLQTLAPEDARGVAEAVTASGGEVTGVSALTRWGLVRAVLPLGAIGTLAARGDVQWIEETPPVTTLNDLAASAPHLNASTVWNTAGLTGKGQLVGHADTGLDTGSTNTVLADFQGNIRALLARARPGDASDFDGHGTHTAGSILGNGTTSGGQFRGIAWEAQLVHQSVAEKIGSVVYFSGLPVNLYELFAETYAYGARIHSDSWGSATYGAYDSDCRSTDLFAWDNPEHLAVFSAGNSGLDSNADGIVDTGAIASPAAAKNVLTVGAAESDRPVNSGGYTSTKYSAFTYGYPTYARKFPIDPIYSDYISSSATLSQGLAAFSSRGPTQDGRIKPDVVAPGTDIISCRSTVGGYGWAPYYPNQAYCFNGGTSMSSPLIAGSAALMRQFAVDRVGLSKPSAALIKAMLIGGARSLTPGQYGTGSAREIPADSPNVVEGWGQPDLSETVSPTNRMACLFDYVGPAATGLTNTLEITVTASNTPLDVALAWIDYPATPAAGITLVNDLDLLVVAPDGSLCRPNGGIARDALNTVETVRLASAQEGVYQIRVIGYSVPYSGGGAAAVYVRGTIAPVIHHAPLSAQIANVPPEPVDFYIQPFGFPTNLAARLFWTTGTASAPTGFWQSVNASWISNTHYRALLPPPPPASYVHYYVRVDADSGSSFLPSAAPEATFSFYADTTLAFSIEGNPERAGTVTPPYGTNPQIRSVPVLAEALSPEDLSNGVRRVCAGWTGTGDVPPAGASNHVALVLNQPSSLTWLWPREFALTNQLRLADAGLPLGETVTWHLEDTLATSETAADLLLIKSIPYAFCGWSVDGVRWPDASSTAPNPATGIQMSGPRLAVGDYLPFWLDTDENGLSDWWELRYFGAVTNTSLLASDDLDGDLWSNQAEFLDNTDPRNPASQPIPPIITVHPLAPFQTQHPPWTVQADISDNLTVEQAFLIWREKGDTVWQTNAMALVSNTLYEAQLIPPSHGAKRVDYYVMARDLVSYYLPQFAATSALYQVIGDYDDAWMTVSPDSFGIVELSLQATNLCVTVSNLAGPDLLWTARVSTATAPFSASDSGWTHSGGNDAWCITSNRTWNGDAVWYCGNPTSRLYPNACHASLDTPLFTVGADGGLLWRQWIKTEPDTPPYFWDGAVVSVSSDGGATFDRLTPTDGYPYRIVPNPASPFPPDQPCLAGNGEGWQTHLLDLHAYAGREVIVRFEFGSDEFVVDEGWYVAGVTPFSFGEPRTPWLTPLDPMGGLLPSMWSASLTLQAEPSHLAFDEEAVACIRVAGDNPDHRPLIPLTVRKGHRLIASAVGPGTVEADQTFLFRDNQATLTMTADAGAYLYAVTINGVPQTGLFDFDTTSRTFTFSNVSEDQVVQAWFTHRTWKLTVASDFGTATPGPGSHTFTHGTLIEASVTSPILFGGGLSQHACSGWILSGHSPKIGSSNQLSFSLTNDATLVWLWQTNHWLYALAAANGTVAPSEGWYKAGDYACVTAYPALYYHLVTWVGDNDSSIPDGNRLSLPMTRPRVIVAMFSENLTPTHQVPESWLASYGWTEDFEAAAEGDSDADGMATWKEWASDTDPTNTLSLLKLTGLLWTNEACQISWIGGTLRTQLVQQAATPGGPWLAIQTNLPPTPITNVLARPLDGPAGFYRIAIP